jgi:endothelin-converting enzyme/putative endopeptidase
VNVAVCVALAIASGCGTAWLRVVTRAPAPAVPSGIDPEALDRSVNPCDDFYEFACGGWAARTSIPPDRPAWSRSFSEITERNLVILRESLEADAAGRFEPGDEEARKLGDFYATCMDEGKAETASAETLRESFATIDAITDRENLARTVAGLHLREVSALFVFRAQQDLGDATEMIGAADQGGLGLPERDYYLKQDARSVDLRRRYEEHVEHMLELAGDSPGVAAKHARTVMRIETALARGSMPVVERRDPYKVYHRIDRAGLAREAPAFPWSVYFVALGYPEIAAVNVAVPGFFAELNRVLTTTRIADLRTYLRWQLLHASARALGSRFVDEDFRFTAVLTGTERLLPRWKRCVGATDQVLGEALAKPFVRRTFPLADRARARTMIEGIERSFDANLASLSWMDAETRARALEKAVQIANKIGFPDWWRDYGALEIDRTSYLANLMRGEIFEARRQLDEIGRPVDRTEWLITPPTVNAYYNPSLNEIVFPAGILQPPFFMAAAPDAVNYGAIGMVMGHELTHGFDDQGRKFDGHGNLRDWWSPPVAEAFTERAACLVRQFDAYVAAGDQHVNGKLTLGENIADQGGLKLAYAAYRGKRARATRMAPPEIFTGEQQFFISFAQSWCTKRRPDLDRLLANVDPHSPPRYRVDGAVANSEAFAAAFSCPAGSPMAPPMRCAVW